MRVLALVFLALAAHRTATLALPLVAPAYMGVMFEYEAGRAQLRPDPYVLLPVAARTQVEPDAAARARFESRLNDRGVRLRLFLLELAGRLPELAVMYCIGIALWRSSRPGVEAALSGVPWLLRAAIAGLVMAVATPVAEAVRTGLLLSGVAPTATFDINIDLDEMQRNLLFAAAALAATWTISAGLRARADLAEIV
ncbi:MAG TPA: hypothetical protein VF662_07360 [Allosphingosinicella sp.]